jgi:hypothetical protein
VVPGAEGRSSQGENNPQQRGLWSTAVIATPERVPSHNSHSRRVRVTKNNQFQRDLRTSNDVKSLMRTALRTILRLTFTLRTISTLLACRLHDDFEFDKKKMGTNEDGSTRMWQLAS